MFWNRLVATFHRLFSRKKTEDVPAADATVPANGDQSREQP
jgi:hypothetical protein